MATQGAILAGVAALSLCAASFSAQAQEVYALDEDGHTEIFFGWSHAGVSQQHGEFTRASGTLTLFPGDIGRSSLDVSVEAGSIWTGHIGLNAELKGGRWFNTADFPDIRFISTSVEQTSAETAKVTGNLTMRDVTLPVTLDATLTHRGPHPLGGSLSYFAGDWVAFHATGELDHMAFGVGPYSTGPITLEINAEFKEK